MYSNNVALQVIYLLHLLEQLLFPVVLASRPLPPKGVAVGDQLAEGQGVDEAVLEGAWVDAHAGCVVRVVLLAEVAELVGNVQVVQLVSEWGQHYFEYFLECT